MIGRIFPSWIERTLNGAEGYSGETFVALLLKASYTFDGTDVFISDLTPASNELSGGNYARVNPVGGLSITRSGSITSVTWNPVTFGNLTATGAGAPRSMILATWSGAESTSSLILQQDFELATDANGEDVTITPAASGLLRFTSSP